jgi:hypothetical protein
MVVANPFGVGHNTRSGVSMHIFPRAGGTLHQRYTLGRVICNTFVLVKRFMRTTLTAALIPPICLGGMALSTARNAAAAYIFDLAPQSGFTLVNTSANGFVSALSETITVTGGNDQSGNPGTTDYVAAATTGGILTFNWSYTSLDDPGLDSASFLLGGTPYFLADTNGESGLGTFDVSAGQIFGFRVATADNQGEPGILTVSNTVPEPRYAVPLCFVALTFSARSCFRRGPSGGGL